MDTRRQQHSLNDSVKLHTLLPDLVWRKVLDTIPADSGGEMALSESNLYFRDLLMERRVSGLMGRALVAFSIKHGGNLESSLEDSGTVNRGNNGEPNAKKLKTTTKVITNSKANNKILLIKLRTISKGYKFAIDSFMEKINFEFKSDKGFSKMSEDFSNNSNKSSVRASVQEQYAFESRSRVKKFTRNFRESHGYGLGNPFIGRSVVIKDNIEDEDQRSRFLRALYNFLDLFGSEIIHICLEENSPDIPVANKYIHMKNVLSRVPNLQLLDVYWNWKDSSSYSKPEMMKRLSSAQATNVPNIRSLVMLRLYNLPCIVVNELLSANSQILHLDAHFFYDTRSYNFENALYGLRDLKSVELGSRFFSKVTFKSLYDIARRVQRLGIINYYHEEGTLENWKCFFKGLIDFFDSFASCNTSARQLTFKLPTIPGIPLLLDLIETKQDYPQLTTLEFPPVDHVRIYLRFGYNIDLLLPTTATLKTLEVHLGSKPKDLDLDAIARRATKYQIIKFLGYESRLYESNIWELFPELDQVTIMKHKGDEIWRYNRLPRNQFEC